MGTFLVLEVRRRSLRIASAVPTLKGRESNIANGGPIQVFCGCRILFVQPAKRQEGPKENTHGMARTFARSLLSGGVGQSFPG
jgi:hypothetical protein